MDVACEEDQRLLDAALTYLDEFDPLAAAAQDVGSLDVLGAPEEFEVANAQGHGLKAIADAEKVPEIKRVRPKPGSHNPNRAREERKNELVFLRSKIMEMETQITERKQANGGGTSSTSLIETNSTARRLLTARTGRPTVGMLTSSGRTHGLESVWEEIATRQYRERHKAELENVRLKLTLKEQIKVAKSLESVLRKRAAMQLLQMYRDNTASLSKRRRYSAVEDDDPAIYEMLLADLDRSVQEVDAVFQANGLSNMEGSFQDATVRNSDEGLCLEMFASKVMPFDIHATSDAVWLHLAGLQERIPFRTYYERQPKNIETTDDTIVESYGIEIQSTQTSAHFRARNMMRRFVQPDRILIACRMIYEPVEFSSQPTSGICFYEKGYILIKRHPTARSPEFSLMQTSFIMTPERFGPAGTWNESTVGQLSSFFLDTTARNIYASHQMIENYLLEESAQRQEECTVIHLMVRLCTPSPSLRITTMSEDEDEDALLSSALSFLDDLAPLDLAPDLGIDAEDAVLFDVQGHQLSVADTLEVRPSGVPKPRKSRSRPNRARDERKNELVYLRNLVREMQTQLDNMQLRGGHGKAVLSRLVSTPVQAPTTFHPSMLSRGRLRKTKSYAFVWEAIAARQFSERHRAELENVRLKKSLENQVKIAHDLERLIKRSKQVQGDGFMALSLQRHHVNSLQDDAAIYEKLLQEVNNAILEVDDVFKANGLSYTEDPVHDSTTHTSAMDGSIHSEVFANTMMPFDVQTTSGAVWRFLDELIERIPNRSYYGRKLQSVSCSETDGDTILESYGVKIEACGTSGHFLLRQATKRFVQPDRVLVTWSMMIDPVEFSCQPLTGLHFFEKGFVQIKRPITRSPDFSLVQWSSGMRLEWTDKQSYDETKMRQLCDFSVDCTAQKIYHSCQMIENFLVDEAMKKPIV